MLSLGSLVSSALSIEFSKASCGRRQELDISQRFCCLWNVLVTERRGEEDGTGRDALKGKGVEE